MKPFHPEEKIIEYVLKDKSQKKLIDMSIRDFADETASESFAPGGGSISAYVGVLGVSLGTMVANLSAHKPGWDSRWEEFSNWAVKGQKLKDELLFLVDEDTNAFNQIIEAVRLPKSNSKEQEERKNAIENATKYATEIPFKVMETALDSLSVMKKMVEIGNQNSLSDAAVGALCAKTAIAGAFLNVRINAKDLNDKNFAKEIIKRAKNIFDEATHIESEIIKIVNEMI